MEILLPKKPERTEILRQMQEDTVYDVSCGGDAQRAVFLSSGILAPKAPDTPAKIFLCGKCTFNCAYCACRAGSEREGYLHTPREAARLAVAEAEKTNCGVFLSSAVCKSADETQQMLAESVRIMRRELGYRGYIHAKVMPGADPLLIAETGRYADRLSVNIEVAHSSGYEKIAKQKTRTNILAPMSQISDQIAAHHGDHRPFAKSQTTQLMAGSTGEDDRAILRLSSALYRKYRLKRVYYTAFRYLSPAKGYESSGFSPVYTPVWRTARLYQADSLIRLYGFSPDEVAPDSSPFLSETIDPKTAYALRHPDLYPVEVNRADFDTLIRVPGIGITSAKKIFAVRKSCTVTHEILKKMRISLKRSAPFLTCAGKFCGEFAFSDRFCLEPAEQIPLFNREI